MGFRGWWLLRKGEREREFRLLFNRRSHSLSVAWRNNLGLLSRFTIKSKRTPLCQTISPLTSPSFKHDLYIILPTPRPQRTFLVSSCFNMVGKISSPDQRFIPPMLANIADILLLNSDFNPTIYVLIITLKICTTSIGFPSLEAFRNVFDDHGPCGNSDLTTLRRA